MKLNKCPFCGKKFAIGAKFCVNCGAEVREVGKGIVAVVRQEEGKVEGKLYKIKSKDDFSKEEKKKWQ